MKEENSDNLIDELQQYLAAEGKLAYFNSARNELTVRCPFCGDSIKNLKHGHMYIATVAPYSYFCQRCETKGFLNFESLREFQVEGTELAIKINRSANVAIKSTTKKDKDTDLSLLGKRNLMLPSYNENSKIFQRKLKYLETRFGRELSVKDLAFMKVIMNYDDFIDLNNLRNLEKFYDKDDYHRDLRLFLRRYSVGFLSTDTNYVTFRHTKLPSNNRRYYTESNNRPVDIGSRIYTIHNKLDLMAPTLNLVLAEGPFDIGSVWLNMYDRLKSPNTVFGAVNGRAYKLFINTMLRMGFFKINLDLYSDAEIPLNHYKYSLDFQYFNSIKIHYNTHSEEKDFGVAKNLIRCKTFKLK